jgi:hypothetical protein
MKPPKLYKRGDIYWFTATGPEGPDGRREWVRQSTGETEYGLACAKVMDAFTKMHEAHSAKVLRKCPHLIDFLPTFEDRISADANLAPKTKTLYAWAIGILKKAEFAKMRMDAITDDVVAVEDLGNSQPSHDGAQTLAQSL